MGGLAARVDEVLAEIPMKEAVRYKKGNLKWTRSDVKSHSEALACGLIELGCKVCSMIVKQTLGARAEGWISVAVVGLRALVDFDHLENGTWYFVNLGRRSVVEARS